MSTPILYGRLAACGRLVAGLLLMEPPVACRAATSKGRSGPTFGLRNRPRSLRQGLRSTVEGSAQPHCTPATEAHRTSSGRRLAAAAQAASLPYNPFGSSSNSAALKSDTAHQ